MDIDPTHTLVDPDLQNASEALDWSGSTKPKSNGHRWRKMGRFWTDPVHMLHKRKEKLGFIHLVSLFSFFFSLLLRWLYETLNLTLLYPTQKRVIHGSKASSYCSNHKSIAGIHMHWLNRCRSWVLFRGFRTVLVQFFGSNLFLNDFACGFVGLQQLLLVVNPWIFHVFLENFRVSWFRTKTLQIPYGFTSVWISLLFMSMKR